ncbi:sugar phosphate isomerase/epimerase family protein [Halocatena halophila]|uniref:sugar phosphate isomerase/epimerase family protein n=1 Tax=Halocatena halophila TaxID=2814576 RepID=UPI002ED39A81
MSAESPRFGASLDVRFEESIAEFASFLEHHGLNHIEVRQGYVDVQDGDVLAPLENVLASRDFSVTFHAPHIDCAMGNRNERLRNAAVEGVKHTLDMATAVDAGGVVVHGGSSRVRYPAHVQARSREQALRSIEECTRYAADVGVPLCLENSRDKSSERRHTATPDRMAAFLSDLDIDSEYLRLTLDVGHAKASGVPYERFVDRFGDRIHVLHLHDNDGTADDHEPLSGYREIAAHVGATYNVLEMKALSDIAACVA